MRPRGQRASAVAEAEQRVELLDQLGRRHAPADRADADRMARRRLARDLEDRERDVEPAAQVDVAVGLLLELRVAGRLERLDQAVLEHQRAELRLGRLVVDVLGLAGPGRGRGEVRPSARAQADRLADVQRPAVGVAEDVDAGILGQPREVGPVVAAAGGLRRLGPRGAAGSQQGQRLRHRARVRAQARQQGAQHARAGLGVGQRAVGGLDLDPQRIGERGEAAAALERRQPARERHRAHHRRVRPLELGALERLLEHADVEPRRVGDEDPALHLLGELGQDMLGRRRLVDHRLGDPGEALDAAAERLGDADQRAPAVVQLAAADQHGAHLGQLAALLRLPVGLGVDGEELSAGEQAVEEGGFGHRAACLTPRTGRHARALAVDSPACA